LSVSSELRHEDTLTSHPPDHTPNPGPTIFTSWTCTLHIPSMQSPQGVSSGIPIEPKSFQTLSLHSSQKAHTQKAHTQKAHTQKAHTQKAHTQKAHTSMRLAPRYSPEAFTESSYNRSLYSHRQYLATVHKAPWLRGRGPCATVPSSSSPPSSSSVQHSSPLTSHKPHSLPRPPLDGATLTTASHSHSSKSESTDSEFQTAQLPRSLQAQEGFPYLSPACWLGTPTRYSQQSRGRSRPGQGYTAGARGCAPHTAPQGAEGRGCRWGVTRRRGGGEGQPGPGADSERSRGGRFRGSAPRGRPF